MGKRALGERLTHQIEAAAFRAATVLLLCAPQTPLSFMGQEWALLSLSSTSRTTSPAWAGS